MISKIKYYIVLSFLAVFSLPDVWAQCWLSEAERNVSAVGGETLTIGETLPRISAPGSGRKVCYKWTPSQYITEGSDLNSPTVSVHLPQNVGTYHFHVKRISEDGVQNCDISVTVEDAMEFVAITPKRGCVKKGESPNVSEFDIITNPQGMQKYAKIIRFYKAYPETDYNDPAPDYMVVFALEKNGHEYDKDSVTIVRINNDISHYVDINYVEWANGFRKVNEVCKNIGDIMGKKPGFFVTPEINPIEVRGTLRFENSTQCCADKMLDKYTFQFTTASLGSSARIKFGYNAVAAQLYGYVDIGWDVNFADKTITFGGCESNFEFATGKILTVHLTGGIEADLIHEDFCAADASVTGEMSAEAITVKYVNGQMKVQAFSICGEVYASFSIKLASFLEIGTRVQLVDQKCWSVINN